MIYSVLLNLEAERDAEIASNLGFHIYALFLGLIRSVDEPLAEKLHSGDSLKPFTVSPLLGEFTHRNGGIIVRRDEQCQLRFTALEDEIFARLMENLVKFRAHVRLQKAHLRVTDAITSPQGSPWAGFASFEGLLEQKKPDRKISFEFASPTVFRSEGRRNIAFPSPELVFGSLLTKWNSFSEIKIDSNLLDSVKDDVLVSRYKLETRMLNYRKYQELGFIGTCDYEINGRVSADTLRQLNAVADFAFFSGVGAKTTMGMGQVRRI